MVSFQALTKGFASACCGNYHGQTIFPHTHQVFINHRGTDTERNISGLLHDHLLRHGLRPFLDYRNLKAGEKFPEKINTAIRNCKVGVVVFSPRYCESFYCLHELALLMEYQKRVVPIFYNVKPSQLRVGDIHSNGTGRVSEKDLERFSRALGEAKNNVGLCFDSSRGYWSDFIRSASDAITEQIDKSDPESVSEIESGTFVVVEN